MKVTN